MYVCICKAVTDEQIARELADGAQSLRDLQQRLGVATGCGRCGTCVREMVAEHHRKQEHDVPGLPAVDTPLPA